MPGPQRDPTKHWSRAHRNGSSAAAPVVLPASNELEAPPLPAGVAFTAEQMDTWSSLWATGASTMWSDADLDSVAVMVLLLHRTYAGDASTAELVELRHLRDALGLTPSGRSRLGWEASA